MKLRCRLFGHEWRYEVLDDGWVGGDTYYPVYGKRLPLPCFHCGEFPPEVAYR